MKFKWNNKYACWGVTAFLVIAAGIVFYYLVFHGANITEAIKTITTILMPVVVGMVISYLLSPVLNNLEKKVLNPLADKLKIKKTEKRNKWIRVISILFTTFFVFLCIYLFFYMIISQIVPSVQNIAANFDVYIDNFTNWINELIEKNPDIIQIANKYLTQNTEDADYFTKMISRYSTEIEKWVMGILPQTSVLLKTISASIFSIIGFLWNFVIGFIIAIYVMASKETFTAQAKKLVYAVLNQDSANHFIRNVRFTNQTFIGFIGGKIVDSIIIGLLCFIGTTLMSTPYAALVSVIVGVTNVIPFFGPYFGAVPSALLIFMVNPMKPLNCVYFIIFIVILQQFDGNILGPKILGSSTGLTGFWVIFSITIFGGMFGVLGMIVGVPIFAVIYAAVKSLVNNKLIKRGYPIESEAYQKLDYIDEMGFHDFPIPEEDKKAVKKESVNKE